MVPPPSLVTAGADLIVDGGEVPMTIREDRMH
jgi:hypothetical protein